MESYLSIGGANAGIRVNHGDVSLVAGIGRHRVRVSDTFSAANESADQLIFTFTGDLVIPGLRIGSGYVGSILPTAPQRLSRDSSFPLTFDVEVTDDQVRKIEERRSVNADGSFDLVLNIRFEAIGQDGNLSQGSGQLQPHKFSRDAWLEGLRQVGFRHVQIIELEVLDSSSDLALSKGIEFFTMAQTRYLNGEYREVAECLRQALNVIVGIESDDESDTANLSKEIGEIQREARSVPVGYPDRIELVRRSLKFTADIGAHPEAGHVNRPEALALLHMSAGLIQWYASY